MEEQKNKENKSVKQSSIVKGLLDGTLLTRDGVVRQMPYILFLCLLAIIYTGNRFHAEKVVRQRVKLQREIKELHSESITTASELMKLSRQSEVIELVNKNGLDLKESVVPPRKIVIED